VTGVQTCALPDLSIFSSVDIFNGLAANKYFTQRSDANDRGNDWVSNNKWNTKRQIVQC
jgi:hypothetical protein